MQAQQQHDENPQDEFAEARLFCSRSRASLHRKYP